MRIPELTSPTDIATLIVGIQSPNNATRDIESYFAEFRNLVRSDGIIPTHEMFIKLREINPAYFIGSGKVNDIIELCKKENIGQVVFSEPLLVQQVRNLSKVFGVPVIDRVQLILEIFERGAHSAEGKLQVELAVLQFQKARLVGWGKLMSQQAGKVGTRGPGETQKEKDTRHIEHLMIRIRRDLKHLQKVRETQRKQRLGRNIPLICLVGYTNAGKSTILNKLTRSNVLAEDKLFATLDTTTRELYLDGAKKALISDTVGFIQQLPHSLIEAFKSTLSELQYAHLLLHVVDISDGNWESHIAVVHAILKEINVDKPMLYVFNKADRAKNLADIEYKLERYQPYVINSATSDEGIAPLIEFLRTWKPETTIAS